MLQYVENTSDSSFDRKVREVCSLCLQVTSSAHVRAVVPPDQIRGTDMTELCQAAPACPLALHGSPLILITINETPNMTPACVITR